MVVLFKRWFCLVFVSVSINAFAANVNIPTLSTSGYGEVVAKPDMADFSVSIQAERSQANQAKQAVDKVVINLVTSLTNEGVDRKDIVSGHLQLSPQYTYPKEAKPVLNGYRAVRNITVTVNQLDKLNNYLDASLKAGINKVNNIQLKVKNEGQYKKQARQAAIADAKEKAEELSEGFGTSLDSIWSIVYRSHSARPVMMAKSVMMESTHADQTYQDQSMVISDQVDVVFKLSQEE